MIVQILFERGYVMALSDETLEQIVSNLTPEEREQLFSQLSRQIEQDKSDIANGKEPLSPPTKPKQKKIIQKGNGEIHCCVYCGSTKLKSHGATSAGNQRYKTAETDEFYTE